MRGSLVIAAAVLLMQDARAQDLHADVSQRIVELRYDFAGADLLLFGAVGAPTVQRSPLDLAVVVSGPPEAMVVRRKARIAGVWLNAAEVAVPAAPGYYALAATRSLEEIAPPQTLARMGLGLAWMPVAVEGATDERERRAFRDGFVRNMQAVALYSEHPSGVRFTDGPLFRAEIRLPSNVPVGEFSARVVLFAEGRPVAERTIAIAVDKIGFERAVFTFSRARPLLYGLVAVAVALVAGWLAGALSRR